MRPIRKAERGSVFVVALMVLVMLTVIGLSLALVTETEMLLGGNERVINETFYAAEAGVAVAVGQAMLAATDKKCFALLAKEEGDADRMVGVRQLGYSVDSSSLYPVAFDVAPYSKANEGRGDILFSAFFRGEARALRGTWIPLADGGRDVPREPEEALDDIPAAVDFTIQGEKTIDLAFYVSPIETTIDVGSFDHPEVFGCDEHPLATATVGP